MLNFLAEESFFLIKKDFFPAPGISLEGGKSFLYLGKVSFCIRESRQHGTTERASLVFQLWQKTHKDSSERPKMEVAKLVSN